MNMTKKQEIDKIHQSYKEIIDRKDKQIEELKKENIVLLKLSLKQGEKNIKLQGAVEKKFK